MRQGLKACVFDAYGTLFDLHSAVTRHSAEIGPAAPALSSLWRGKQLEYSWMRSAMAAPADGWKDFWSLTEDALDFAMVAMEVQNTRLRQVLLDAYLKLDPFPEVPSALRALKAMGMQTAILSNGSLPMLRSALKSSGIGEWIDVVCSADEVRIFKPSPRLYGLAAEKLGISPRETMFFSSNAWDAAAGSSFGFEVAWINRTSQRREYPFAPLAVEKADLSDAIEVVQRQIAA